MVDPLRLRALLDRLLATESELRRLRGLDIEKVRGDPDRLNSVKYLFVIAAEVAIDAGQHIISSEGLTVPESFAAVFTELGEHGWLGADLARSLTALARFRNLLVHGYARIDDDRVLEILHSDAIGDLARFREQVTGRALVEGTDASDAHDA